MDNEKLKKVNPEELTQVTGGKIVRSSSPSARKEPKKPRPPMMIPEKKENVL